MSWSSRVTIKMMRVHQSMLVFVSMPIVQVTGPCSPHGDGSSVTVRLDSCGGWEDRAQRLCHASAKSSLSKVNRRHIPL